MYKLIIAMLLSLSLSLPVAAAEGHGGARGTEAAGRQDMNRNLSLIGGGLVGLLVAAGLVNLMSAGAMLYEGAGFTEAMETGAGLSIPVTVLSAVLGAVLAQDFVLRNIEAYQAGGHPTSAH
jgi:hypothetical protein